MQQSAESAVANAEGTVSGLLGYDEVEREFASYQRPIILIGPEGTGKRTWIERHLPEDKLCIRTDASKSKLDEMAQIFLHQSSFIWMVHIDRWHNLSFLSSLFRSVPKGVTVLAYTDMQLPEQFFSIASVYYSPYLTEEQLFTIAKSFGLKDDEAEFAARAAGGIPGNIEKSFEKLRAKRNVLEALEYIREDDYRSLVRVLQKVTDSDIDLLESALVSFKTGTWTFFAETEVEPLKRVVNLMEECLWNNYSASKDISARTIFVAALHAYHGRV